MISPLNTINEIKYLIKKVKLDLKGLIVLTEAATGNYVITPIIAALANAKMVFAYAKDSKYGSLKDVKQETQYLARLAGILKNVKIITEKNPKYIGMADIITNSGHLRPIDKSFLSSTKRTAVIPLMYEAWEFRDSDVDLNECWKRKIPVLGTNEEKEEINVFQYLGPMCAKQLLEYQMPILGTKVLLICDNRFAYYIAHYLIRMGAKLYFCGPKDLLYDKESRRVVYLGNPFLNKHLFKKKATRLCDISALIVACSPLKGTIIGNNGILDIKVLKSILPGIIVFQFWGQIDRKALSEFGLPFYPKQDPGFGHMGITPDAVGVSPVIRLQIGGLKVGQIMARSKLEGNNYRETIKIALRSGYAQDFPLILKQKYGTC